MSAPSETLMETCKTCRCRQGDHNLDRYEILPAWEAWHASRDDDFLCHGSLVRTPEGMKRTRPCVGWLRYKAARNRGERPTLQHISDASRT